MLAPPLPVVLPYRRQKKKLTYAFPVPFDNLLPVNMR